MRSNTLFKAFLLAISLAGVFLLMRSKVSGADVVTPEKESMEECIQQSNGERVEKLGFESLPHQFFSSF